MKKFFAFLAVIFLVGTTVAWAVNYQRFGKRTSYFDRFTMSNSSEIYDSLLDRRLGEVEVDSTSRARVEVIGDLSHDFGVMAPNTDGEHTFRVKNVGESELTLRLGATTCKCTLGELENTALAPGQETDIKLSWTVQPGNPEFTQTAQVITNDPKVVVLNFKITGRVIKDFEVVPQKWTFGEVATGEPIEIQGTIYNFSKRDIKPTELSFSSEELNELATFEVEPFEPTPESDGVRGNARQGFRVTAKIAPGMKQGAVSQNFLFAFVELDDNGKEIPRPESADADSRSFVVASTQGRIVGWLGMLPNSKIKGEPGGGYIFNIGKIGRDDPLTVKTYVVLKGDERENTKLSVGGIVPDSVLKASLGEPKGRGSMTLYPLEIEFMPGAEKVERLGNNSKDYGQIMIMSDNPKVTKMRIALKFSVEGR